MTFGIACVWRGTDSRRFDTAFLEPAMNFTRIVAIAVLVSAGPVALLAQAPVTPAAAGYLLPPKAVVDVLDAPPPPMTELSPSRDVVVLLERTSMPSIAELAQPMLRLAGVRINPRTNAPHRSNARYRNLTLKVVADGSERKVTLPPAPVISWIGYSPDGRRFAFTNLRDTGMELWIGETATGSAKAVTPAQLNAVFGPPCAWIGDGTSLLCAFTNSGRGPAPAAPEVPAGPNVQESRGRVAPTPTVQDMLTSAHDEAVFEYYGTSQLATVHAASGRRAPIGRPAMYTEFKPSPDGQYLLVARIKRPFSWLVRYDDFPTTVEIWDGRGAMVKTVADLPTADNVPRGGVLTGPRSWRWHPIQPASVAWAEALDEGNPKTQVPHRDRIMTWPAPFTATPTELARTEYRFQSITWTSAGAAWLTETNRDTRAVRTSVIDAPGAAPRTLWERSSEDAYANPGAPMKQPRPSNADALLQVGDHVYLTGVGSSPQGDRPFLDKVNIKTGAKERLFQTEEGAYEPVVALLSDDGSKFITRFETRSVPPNVYVRGRESNSRRPLTTYADPAPPLKGVKSEMVTYSRKDGVQMRATIHTPPGWTPDQGRLPALLWAYPREFADPKMASQVTGSPHRFTTPGWSTLHMLFLTQGFAVIDDPTMPIVGAGETANDTYVEQLVASAQAAVDKAVAMGIVDADRVVAGGHSYGAFMTANLLAHSDIFRAGIARSGAYNRTLTPFGFQNEERSFWQVPQLYARMSPFNHADKINEPILLVHGEADDNAGTYPVQSERLYRALKGHGATVRYVTLPHEAHGYVARESVLHTVAEMLNWANEFGKNAKPRAATTAAQR
jgi:dipeptidyl aminopeptidase/acylaminoacyl peptidase